MNFNYGKLKKIKPLFLWKEDIENHGQRSFRITGKYGNKAIYFILHGNLSIVNHTKTSKEPGPQFDSTRCVKCIINRCYHFSHISNIYVNFITRTGLHKYLDPCAII